MLTHLAIDDGQESIGSAEIPDSIEHDRAEVLDRAQHDHDHERVDLRARFDAAGCDRCVYGSPTGDRCHPVVCGSFGVAACMAGGGGGQGTCVNMDRVCPADTQNGMPCTEQDDHCMRGATTHCFCTGMPRRWMCYF